MTCFTVFYGTSHSLVVYRYFFVEQCVGTLGMTMFLTGGNTETILISCFSNMKIYTRYCVAAANDFIRLRGVVVFYLVSFSRACARRTCASAASSKFLTTETIRGMGSNFPRNDF